MGAALKISDRVERHVPPYHPYHFSTGLQAGKFACSISSCLVWTSNRAVERERERERDSLRPFSQPGL